MHTQRNQIIPHLNEKGNQPLKQGATRREWEIPKGSGNTEEISGWNETKVKYPITLLIRMIGESFSNRMNEIEKRISTLIKLKNWTAQAKSKEIKNNTGIEYVRNVGNHRKPKLTIIGIEAGE